MRAAVVTNTEFTVEDLPTPVPGPRAARRQPSARRPGHTPSTPPSATRPARRRVPSAPTEVGRGRFYSRRLRSGRRGVDSFGQVVVEGDADQCRGEGCRPARGQIGQLRGLAGEVEASRAL